MDNPVVYVVYREELEYESCWRTTIESVFEVLKDAEDYCEKMENISSGYYYIHHCEYIRKGELTTCAD